MRIDGYGQIDHEESENRSPETLGFILSDPGPKNPKKSLFRDFKIRINQIDHEESENRGSETINNDF